MRNKKRLKFIVNPFAGVGNKSGFRKKLVKHLDKSLFDYEVAFTEGAGHAVVLSQNAVEEEYDIVVAVGGDGSVNEVAKSLINTNVVLGIIPAGSGNGFATHLGYKRNIVHAIKSLGTASITKIDTCQLNDLPFINVAGVGFDAWVAYKINNRSFRGFIGYMKTALQETASYKLQNFKIKIDGKELEREALSVEVANATMFGYNMKIAPLARLDDGLLDVVIIKKAPKLRYFPSMVRFPMGTIHKSRLVEYYKAKEVEIIPETECAAHIDGEGFLVKDKLSFRINQLSLSVLSPKKLKKDV